MFHCSSYVEVLISRGFAVSTNLLHVFKKIHVVFRKRYYKEKL